MTQLDQPLVLYVDDEAANRTVFGLNFGQHFRVESVDSAEAALERMAKEVPAVVVSDQRLPGMQGTELLAEVRRAYPETVRMIVTAYGDSEPMLRAINVSGAVRYLVKPWSRSEMIAVLQGAIETFVLARRNQELVLQLLEAQRFAALGTLAATVAHDMSSPLSAIVSNLERLGEHAATFSGLEQRLSGALEARTLTKAERNAAEELPEIAHDVQESAAYLRRLVIGMRVQARSSSSTERADARIVAGFAASIVRSMVIEHGGLLEVEVAEMPRASISSTELCQVLVNLLTNSAQALDRTLAERRVRLEGSHQDGRMVLVVSDTGAGMTPEQVAKAGRERFTTKPPGTGTGLGLSICREIVEHAGGRFELTSKPGSGTQVKVWLPLGQASGEE